MKRKITKSELIDLQNRYIKDREIGEVLGISRQAVFQQRKKFGILSPRTNNPDRNKKIFEMVELNGKCVKDVAIKFDMSIPSIYKIVEDMKKCKKDKQETSPSDTL